MNRRSILSGLAIMGAMLGLHSGPGYVNYDLMQPERNPEREPRRRRSDHTAGIPDNPAKVIPAGCKEYEFFGFKVIALSEKRAQAKALKMYNNSRK